MGIIQLVERDVNHKIFLGEGHVLIHLFPVSVSWIFRRRGAHLQGFVEVADLTEIIKE